MSSAQGVRVMWFRRDLRLRDNPALLRAAEAEGVVPLFVLDPQLWKPAGPPRRAWLVRSLAALSASMDGKLLVRRGDPATVVAEVARHAGAEQVHIAADTGPYGRERDARVERALEEMGVELVRSGSPYAVGPGRVVKGDGSPFRVYTPFYRAWRDHGWPEPAATPRRPAWVSAGDGDELPEEPDIGGMVLPDAGERAALKRWHSFRDGALASYDGERNRPDLASTSQLSVHLKYGEIHPRTLLADLAGRTGAGAETFRKELAWREFYADVLWHRPETARDYYDQRYAKLPYDSPGKTFAAWQEGRTGFPMVDAGMRQLRAEGWMHNRVRMIVASFLLKDLHIEWQHGAREFMHWLRDGDLASNNHGWQWVAGSGTDAAPYYRVFNPVSQGVKFDPEGDYVRRHVPELAHLPGKAAHEPWEHEEGYSRGYPERIVDHQQERAAALEGFESLRR